MTYVIEQEDPRESLMTVRTRDGWLAGWYFPTMRGTVSVTRFDPPVSGAQVAGHVATDMDAVAWIARGYGGLS